MNTKQGKSENVFGAGNVPLADKPYHRAKYRIKRQNPRQNRDKYRPKSSVLSNQSC
jgi:hypothetical protein